MICETYLGRGRPNHWMFAAALAAALFQDAQPDVRAVSAAQQNFGINLLRVASLPGQNTAISPNNVLYALAGLYPGSSGATRSALASALGIAKAAESQVPAVLSAAFKSSAGTGAVLETAAAAWMDANARPSADYAKSIEEQLAYQVFSVDLQDPRTPRRINAWAAEKTKGRIPAIVGAALPRQSRLVLTSALYFMGTWVYPMTPMREPLLFGQRGLEQRTKGMGCNAILPRIESSNYRAVSVPFNGACSAEFYVPKGDTTPEQVADGLLRQPAHFPSAGSDTSLRMPYWKCEWGRSLAQALSRVGLAPIFQQLNELPGIGAGLFVTDVVHRSWIDVNERGVEAAAATAVNLGLGGGPEKPKEPTPFTVDRPFFFVLRNTTTGAALFMAFVYEPTRA